MHFLFIKDKESKVVVNLIFFNTGKNLGYFTRKKSDFI